MIGRTVARGQPRLGLSGHVFLEHLHEARFANARFTAEQHHLSNPLLHLGPALQQQPVFLLPTTSGVHPVLPAASRRLRAMLS